MCSSRLRRHRLRRVLHLSDLHFGRTRADLLEPLIAAVNAAAPDLVAISGDLTQRARRWQFIAARAFLDRLTPRTLVVPGNHDVPLDNLALRLADPFGRYRRWIGADLEPVHRDDALLVVGVNTVNALDWQRGRIGRRGLARAREILRAERGGRTCVIVAHHPFEQPPLALKAPMLGASRAIEMLSNCGADIVLSGHLHAWRAAPFAQRRGREGAILQVQAGTGLSTRLRGEENDFNLLTLEKGAVLVERFVAPEDGAAFSRREAASFAIEAGGWSPRSAGALA